MRLWCCFVCLLFCQIALGQTPDFTANVTVGCAPLTVHFEDRTTGAGSWQWDLGKPGSTSSLQNPSAIYTEPGVYTIRLTVNGNTTTKTAFITVHANPVVNFSFQRIGACSPLPVEFTDLSSAGSGTISEWEWIFGDGEKSGLPSPTHTYKNAGSYFVTLAITNSHGCETSRILETAVEVEGVRAQFETDRLTYCQVPAQVEFINTTLGAPPVTYEWTFDDGATSSEKNPLHTYSQAGEYEVKLVAKNGSQCVGEFVKKVIVASEGGIDFSLSAQKVCVGQAVQMTEAASKVVESRLWNFGNGSTSASFNPSTQYQEAGRFEISLTAQLTGNQCPSIVRKTIEVVAMAEADFGVEMKCGRKVKFIDKSLGASSISWHFGDTQVSELKNPEHTYVAPGSFTVTLTAINSLGCGVSKNVQIEVLPDPVAKVSPDEQQNCSGPNLSGCAPFTIFLENKTEWDGPLSTLWEFADGTESTNIAVSKTYTSKGVFDVLLTVEDQRGCTDTARVKVKVANQVPVPKFEIDKTTVCVREEIKFKDLSQGSNFSCWDFGDEAGSTVKDPTHFYTTPGVYNVQLTSKNDGCAATEVKNQVITVLDPQVDFEVKKNCEDPYAVEFTNLSANFTSIEWKLGDGTVRQDDHFVHRYSEQKEFKLEVLVSNNSTGCSILTEQFINIQDLTADFTTGHTEVCKGEPIVFSDKSSAAVSWEWFFSNGSVSYSQHPAITFNERGWKDARLKVRDSDGCEEMLTITDVVKVIDITGDFSLISKSTCDELAVEFTDRSTGFPEIVDWSWDFGDGEQGSGKTTTHLFQDLGRYAVSLSLKNADGQCSIKREGAVVFTNPVPDFDLITKEYCAGQTVSFINLSQGANEFSWQLDEGVFSTESKPAHTYVNPGYYTITLAVKDVYGCEMSVTKKDFLRIREPVAGFEAFQTSAECPPLVTAFVNKSSNDVVKWSWDFGDGQKSSISTPSNTYRYPGVYNVSLEVEDARGCKDRMDMNGIVSVGGPMGSFVSTGKGCPDEVFLFTATTNNAAIHRWDFGDGTVVEGDPIMTHAYTSAGGYRPILLLIDAKGCQVPLDNAPLVTIEPKPELEMTIDPAFPFAGEEISLMGTADSEADLRWFWLDETKAGDSITFVTDVADTIEITLVAENGAGCKAQRSQPLVLQKEIDFVPNVITPNEDGANDVFRIPAVEQGTWKIDIYNRWGDAVFSESEFKNRWSATGVSGGVYYYLLRNNLRPEKTVKGFVHVIK